MTAHEQLDPTYKLKQALVKERMNGLNLTTLEPDFYREIQEFLKTLSGEKLTELQTSYNFLVLSRSAKIVNLAKSLNIDFREKMTTEERAYFDIICNATIQFKKEVLD